MKGLATTKEVENEMMHNHQEELVKIKQDYARNRNDTIEFLVNSLLSVDLTVPDVIIGKFAAKVLGKV